MREWGPHADPRLQADLESDSPVAVVTFPQSQRLARGACSGLFGPATDCKPVALGGPGRWEPTGQGEDGHEISNLLPVQDCRAHPGDQQQG